MKLLRHGDRGAERPGLLHGDGTIRDLSGQVPDIAGEVLSDAGLERIRAMDAASLPVVPRGTRLGPCVGGTGKFICIGLNYADHAAESGMKVPPEPVIFMKATSAICGPNDPIIIPRGSQKTDWEVELAVIIGTRAKYVSEADALNHVAGYAVANDVSERAFQAERQGQWTKGKSCDNFGQLGPWLVTRDEVADPQDLSMYCRVNGQTMQDGSTRTMVYGSRIW
jgi:2-keto-4-pentenoate hydratase/2-oxohepta-3-ene-1,7-dioic acid hydratase in catechol pathway